MTEPAMTPGDVATLEELEDAAAGGRGVFVEGGAVGEDVVAEAMVVPGAVGEAVVAKAMVVPGKGGAGDRVSIKHSYLSDQVSSYSKHSVLFAIVYMLAICVQLESEKYSNCA
jgi:hypothetical protein